MSSSTTSWLLCPKNEFELMNTFFCDFIKKNRMKKRDWNWLLILHSQITYNLSAYRKKINSFYQALTVPLLAGVLLDMKVGKLCWENLLLIPQKLLRSNRLEICPSRKKFSTIPLPHHFFSKEIKLQHIY